MTETDHISLAFTKIGGIFVIPPENIATKLDGIKAFVFDWDGVFNNGTKDQDGTSLFSEVDSMGTNLLRFSGYMTHRRIPCVAVISGERNSASFSWTRRECFSACYYKIANKTDALNHFCEHFNLKPGEIAFVFDDVLDLSFAEMAGLRIFVQRKANPLFNQFVIKNKIADYVTGSESGNFAVREACELMIGLKGVFEQVITERMAYSDLYREYITTRNEVTTKYFTFENGNTIELNP